MASSISNIEKKRGRGRPATDAKPIGLRLPPDLLASLDAYAADRDLNPDAPSRPEAVRRIVRDWLVGHGYLKQQ